MIQLLGIAESLAGMQPNAVQEAYAARCTARSVVYLTALYTADADEANHDEALLLKAQCALINYDKETLQ